MIDVTVVGRVACMTLVGEFDLVNADEIRAVASALATQGVGELDVDVSGVTFMAAAALNALVVARRCFAGDGRMVVVCPTPGIRRLFELTGLDRPLLGIGA
jgi:anti-sigma B factor antagonist